MKKRTQTKKNTHRKEIKFNVGNKRKLICACSSDSWASWHVIYIAKENLRWLKWKLWDPGCSETHTFWSVQFLKYVLWLKETDSDSRQQQGKKYETVSKIH